jgi:uncharacterized phage protein (TIGR01671 family)
MREIEFRGKRAKNGEWVYGYYYTECGCQYIIENRQKDNPLNRNIPYNVIPETVGQFTGLTDKNGKNIFEGDILSDHGMILISKFSNGSFNFVTRRVKLIVSPVDTTQYDVIGNIYDNPELIK